MEIQAPTDLPFSTTGGSPDDIGDWQKKKPRQEYFGGRKTADIVSKETVNVTEEVPGALMIGAGALGGVIAARMVGSIGMVQDIAGDYSDVLGGLSVMIAGLVAYHFAGQKHPRAKAFFMGMAIGGAMVLLNTLLNAFLDMDVIGVSQGPAETPTFDNFATI